jgi:hypothetical protein
MRKPARPPKPDAPQIEVEDWPKFGLRYPLPPSPPPARRGRPPKPGGPTPQVEVQRAYRQRLKAAGKKVVTRLVDADHDLAMQTTLLAEYRDQLHNTLAKLELAVQDVARLEARNRVLESELVRLEREATNAAKDRIIARREAAAHLQGPRPRGVKPRGNS